MYISGLKIVCARPASHLQKNAILHFAVYNDLRQVLFTESLKIDEHFNSFTDSQEMVFLFSTQDIII